MSLVMPLFRCSWRMLSPLSAAMDASDSPRTTRTCPLGGRRNPPAGLLLLFRRAPLGAIVIPTAVRTAAQGLTLVRFFAQIERFVWDRGCA